MTNDITSKKSRIRLLVALVTSTLCALFFSLNSLADNNHIYSVDVLNDDTFVHTNAVKLRNRTRSTSPGYMSWGREQILNLSRGDTIISIPILKKNSHNSGEIARSEMVIRNSNGIVTDVASHTYHSSDFNNPTAPRHMMPVKYTVKQNGVYKIEHRIEALVPNLVHFRTLSIVGNSLEVHVSNGHATTLARSIGKQGSLIVAGFYGDGSPAEQIHTWQRFLGDNNNHQYFSGIGIFEVNGRDKYDFKLRATNNVNNRATAFIVKEELNGNWYDVFNDAKNAFNTIKEGWSYVSPIVLPLL